MPNVAFSFQQSQLTAVVILATPCNSCWAAATFTTLCVAEISCSLMMMSTTKTNSGWPTPGGRKTHLAQRGFSLAFPRSRAQLQTTKFPARVTFGTCTQRPHRVSWRAFAFGSVRFGSAENCNASETKNQLKLKMQSL